MLQGSRVEGSEAENTEAEYGPCETVQQLLFRAQAARRATTSDAFSNLVDALVGRLSRALDALGHHQEGGAYTDVFMALATAVDVAEALSRKPQA